LFTIYKFRKHEASIQLKLGFLQIREQYGLQAESEPSGLISSLETKGTSNTLDSATNVRKFATGIATII
jgi:hypothetical protein